MNIQIETLSERIEMRSNRLFKTFEGLKKKFAIALLISLILVPNFALAAGSSTNRLQGSHLNIYVDNLYGGIPSAFPDGRSTISATIEAVAKDGNFLQDEPLVISAPSYIRIMAPRDTGDGSFEISATSNRSVKAKVIISLKDYARVKAVLNVNFTADYRITNKSDRSNFIFDQPVTFEAKIAPSMADNIARAELDYTYTRSYMSWIFWTSRRQTVTIDLDYNGDGYFSGTIYPDHTDQMRNKSGSFRYTFVFTDTNGRTFQKTFSGKLKDLYR